MKAVIVVGLLVALGLLAGAVLASPPYGEGPRVVVPFYLAWAGAATVGITLALAWLIVVADERPRAPGSVARAAVLLAAAVVMLGLGEAAVYVAKHPSSPLCTRLPSGRRVCYDQPDTPTAENHAAQLFLGGSAVVAVLAAGAFVAIRRSRPLRAA